MCRIPKLGAVAVLAVALVFMASALAAENSQGSLTRLAADDYTFTVADQSGGAHDYRLRVDGDVTINGKERTIWDLRVGDQVQVTFDNENSRDRVATLIRATRN